MSGLLSVDETGGPFSKQSAADMLLLLNSDLSDSSRRRVHTNVTVGSTVTALKLSALWVLLLGLVGADGCLKQFHGSEARVQCILSAPRYLKGPCSYHWKPGFGRFSWVWKLNWDMMSDRR